MPIHLATSSGVERGEFKIAITPEEIQNDVKKDYEIAEVYKGENWSLIDGLLGLGVFKWLKNMFGDPSVFYLAHPDDLDELQESPFFRGNDGGGEER